MDASIGERLKAARTALGENQAQFAKRFPVEQPVYNRWESGKRNPGKVSQALIERVLAEVSDKTPQTQ